MTRFCHVIEAFSGPRVKMISTSEQVVPCTHPTPCRSFENFTKMTKKRASSPGSSFGRLSRAPAYHGGRELRSRMFLSPKPVGLGCLILELWSGTRKPSRCFQMNVRDICHRFAIIATMRCHRVEFASIHSMKQIHPKTPTGIVGLN